MTKTLRLSFRTEGGDVKTLSVPLAKEGLTDAQVKDAMERMVDSDAVRLSTGGLVSPEKAVLNTLQSTEYNLK